MRKMLLWFVYFCFHSDNLNTVSELKIRTIFHAQDLWKLARSCKQLRMLCPPNPWHLLGIYCITQWISKLPESFEIHMVRQYSVIHDDVIKWKNFPRYWPFVRGIHRSPVNFPHKGQRRGALMFCLICFWRLRKQSWGWWFETLSCSIWRHCNV